MTELESYVKKFVDEKLKEGKLSYYAKASCNKCYGRGFDGRYLDGRYKPCSCLNKNLAKMFELEEKEKKENGSRTGVDAEGQAGQDNRSTGSDKCSSL